MRGTRRRLLACFGAALAGAALPALAVEPRVARRIGLVSFRENTMVRDRSSGMAFLAAMKTLGYEEGRDFSYEVRLWERQEDAHALVRQLVELKVDVIIAAGPPSIVAAKEGTRQIPIVMMYTAEPVAAGIVQSLSRPGGNLTGLTYDHGFESSAKSMELLKEMLPKLRRVAVMWDGTDSVHPIYARYFAKAASQIGLTAVSLELKAAGDVEPAFSRLKREKAEALVVLPSGQITIPQRRTILGLAMRERVPTLFNIADRDRDYPGALLRYGPNYASMPRRAAAYVDRILKGAKPGDIPIEQPDKYDVIVDLTVARKLGVKVPSMLLARADRVIE
jgi:putative tryptophan/tyrosine transport system substrate-binding protein